MSVDREAVLAALRGVVDPARGADIVSADMVRGVSVKGSAVGFSIEVDPRRGAQLEPLRKAAESAVRALPGVESATVVLTAHSEAPAPRWANTTRSGAGSASSASAPVR